MSEIGKILEAESLLKDIGNLLQFSHHDWSLDPVDYGIYLGLFSLGCRQYSGYVFHCLNIVVLPHVLVIIPTNLFYSNQPNYNNRISWETA